MEKNNEYLSKYFSLIKIFIDGEISAGNFEAQFLELYLTDQTMHLDDIYEALQDLFASADDYCDDPELRAHLKQSVDERELLEAAKVAYKKLSFLVGNNL